MTAIKLKHVNAFRDRHGRRRYYFRRPGRKAIALPGLPGSDEFMGAYQVALATLPSNQIGASQTKPGTLNAAIVAYYTADAFTALAPATQAMRRAILERLRTAHGDKRFPLLQREHVLRLLQQMKPFAQRNWLKTIRGLMRFAVDANLRGDDPTANLALARTARSGGHVTWGDVEIEQYRKRHARGTIARVALELMLNVAARRGDAYLLGRQHVKDGRLSWRPNKTRRTTGRTVTVPILPELQAALDAMPASDALTFLRTDYGRPFASAAALGNKFADWCKQARLVGRVGDDGRTKNFRAHGLRKAACRRLAEAGCSAPEIMAVSGHSTLSQVQVYIDDVDQKRMAEAAMGRIANKNYKPDDPRSQTGP